METTQPQIKLKQLVSIGRKLRQKLDRVIEDFYYSPVRDEETFDASASRANMINKQTRQFAKDSLLKWGNWSEAMKNAQPAIHDAILTYRDEDAAVQVPDGFSCTVICSYHSNIYRKYVTVAGCIEEDTQKLFFVTCIGVKLPPGLEIK